MSPRLNPEARAVLAVQRWVLGTWQADALGITRRRIQREVGDGMWQRMTPRTVLALPLDPAPEHFRMAAVLELGPYAVLGGLASLVEAGWSGEDAAWTDVVVPRRSNLHSRPLPSWIRPRYLDHRPTVMEPLARTANASAAIDAATWARTDKEAAFILISAVQQRLVTADVLVREAERRCRTRRLPLIRQVVLEAAAGVASMPEREFAEQCRARGLPEPRRQTPRKDANGRARYTDAEFDLPDGRNLVVEIDGAGHLGVEQAARDAVRASAIARATGAHTLSIGSFALRHDPEPFFAELLAWFSQPDEAPAAA
jgi:hypothetical protein